MAGGAGYVRRRWVQIGPVPFLDGQTRLPTVGAFQEGARSIHVRLQDTARRSTMYRDVLPYLLMDMVSRMGPVSRDG